MKSYYISTLIMAIIAFICWMIVTPLIPNEPVWLFIVKFIGILTISGSMGFTIGMSIFKIKFCKDIDRL